MSRLDPGLQEEKQQEQEKDNEEETGPQIASLWANLPPVFLRS